MIKVKYGIRPTIGAAVEVREGHLMPGIVSAPGDFPIQLLVVDKETGAFAIPYAGDVTVIELESNPAAGVTLNQGRRVAFTPNTEIESKPGYFIAYINGFLGCLIEGDDGKHYSVRACDVEFPEG